MTNLWIIYEYNKSFNCLIKNLQFIYFDKLYLTFLISNVKLDIKLFTYISLKEPLKWFIIKLLLSLFLI